MKLVCIGRNYVAHAQELNNEVPGEPLIFIKPSTALNTSAVLTIPDFTDNLHYELELVLKISEKAKKVSESDARQYYDQIALGIDFTARDIQDKCKDKGHPWEKAKAFDNSASVSVFRNFRDYKADDINFRLEKNGEVVQNGNSHLMIFNFDKLISEASRFFTLEPGDLLYTGTPAGVGPVHGGDELKAYLNGELLLKVKIN